MFVLINNETEPPYRDHMLVDNTKKKLCLCHVCRNRAVVQISYKFWLDWVGAGSHFNLDSRQWTQVIQVVSILCRITDDHFVMEIKSSTVGASSRKCRGERCCRRVIFPSTLSKENFLWFTSMSSQVQKLDLRDADFWGAFLWTGAQHFFPLRQELSKQVWPTHWSLNRHYVLSLSP